MRSLDYSERGQDIDSSSTPPPLLIRCVLSVPSVLAELSCNIFFLPEKRMLELLDYYLRNVMTRRTSRQAPLVQGSPVHHTLHSADPI